MDICWRAKVSKNVGGSLSILRALIVSYKTHGMPQDISRGRAEGALHLPPLQDGMVDLHLAYFSKSFIRPIFSTRLTLVLPCSVCHDRVNFLVWGVEERCCLQMQRQDMTPRTRLAPHHLQRSTSLVLTSFFWNTLSVTLPHVFSSSSLSLPLRHSAT